MNEPLFLPDFTPEMLQPEPLAQAHTIPAAWYTHPGFHPWDRNTVMARSWQLAGPMKDVQNPGDFLVTIIAEKPVIVVRGKDNTLRAFYNVCRHRGGPLATESGHANTLKCRYHGWTYGLDGALLGTPEFDGVECFNPEAFCLPQISVAAWEELVFVNLAENPTPFETVFEGIAERIQHCNIATKQYVCGVTYEVACNWKAYVDNFLEGYHLPQVHPELSTLLDYKSYTTELHAYYSLQYSPLKAAENFYSDGDGEVFYYFIYPNLMLNILPGRMQINRVIPVTADRCQVVFDYYYDNPETEKIRQLIQKDLDYSEVIQQQDMDICLHVQKGLASGSYHRGRFSVKRESGVHHFQTLLKAAYREELTQKHPENTTIPSCSL